MTLFTVSALIIVMLVGRQIFKSYVNPLSVFICVQLFGFFLLYGSDFINTSLIKERTHIIYILSWLLYAFGILIGRMTGKQKEIESNDNVIQVDKAAIQTKIKTLGIVLFISTLLYWIACIRSFGIANFFYHLLHTKESSSLIGVSNVVLYLKMISIFLSPYTLYYLISYRERQIVYWLIFVLTFFANIAYTRNVIIYITMLDVFVLFYSRERTTKKISFRWILYAFLIWAFFAFFNYTQTLFNKQFNMNGTIFGRAVTGGFLTIVSYFSGAFVTTEQYLSIITNTPVLGHTLRSFLNLLGMVGLKIDTTAYQPSLWVYIPFQYNTAPLQYYIFSEGGWIWLALFFVAYGYISYKAYSSYMRKRSITSLMALCFISLLSVLSVREYILVRLDMFVYLILLLICYLQDKGTIRKVVFVIGRHR